MEDALKVAALIPARKGSRRLPRKNHAEVGGVPLWMRAVACAKVGSVDLIVLSTNDGDIVASAATPDIIIMQPDFPQTYDVMLEVMRHADGELWTRDWNVDAIVLLQPTSPLREPGDVSACVDMLDSRSVDAVVSVTEGADDIAFQIRHAGRMEKLPDIVIPNGAIYAIKTSILRAGGSWYGPHTYAYEMPKDRSIDIDTEVDLEMAQLAWERLYGTRR